MSRRQRVSVYLQVRLDGKKRYHQPSGYPRSVSRTTFVASVVSKNIAQTASTICATVSTASRSGKASRRSATASSISGRRASSRSPRRTFSPPTTPSALVLRLVRPIEESSSLRPIDCKEQDLCHDGVSWSLDQVEIEPLPVNPLPIKVPLERPRRIRFLCRSAFGASTYVLPAKELPPPTP